MFRLDPFTVLLAMIYHLAFVYQQRFSFEGGSEVKKALQFFVRMSPTVVMLYFLIGAYASAFQ
jgi:hypothetical protein